MVCFPNPSAEMPFILFVLETLDALFDKLIILTFAFVGSKAYEWFRS